MAAILALLAAVAGCSLTDVGHDYSQLADEPGDRVHWIRVIDLGLVQYVRAEATLISERDLEEHELHPLSAAKFGGHEKLRLLASPRASRAIEASGAEPDLKSILGSYLARVVRRSYVPDDLPIFEVVLLRNDEGLSMTTRALGLARATIPVLIQLDASSARSMVISLTRQMSIIGHEAVHLSERSGGLSFSGANAEDSLLNEEIFASLVASCDRFENILRLELDGRMQIELHKIPSDHPGDADAHFRALRRAGPSPAGTFVAGLIVHEGLPTGVPLDTSEQELLNKRCKRLVEQPRDYLKEYVVAGLPDRWDQYVVPREQVSGESAD
ncbi:MAG: hypothetical protein GVY11_07260 [Gammaproteobacteria bacterium]|jgi:hypothetical protein|nr:hypothetical protein [Gammaproteobacteria bacterium]